MALSTPNLVIAGLLALLAMPVQAEEAYRWTKPFATTKLKPIYHKNTRAGLWQTWENPANPMCHVQVLFTDLKQQQQTKTLVTKAPSNCQAVVVLDHMQLDAQTYLQDWASERGGTAWIFHNSEQGLQTLAVHYMTNDEETLEAKKAGNTIVLKGSNGQRQIIEIQPSGQLTLRPPKRH